MGYGQEKLKDILENEAEVEEQQQEPAAAKEEEEQQQGPAAAKEQQQQDDDEQYDTVAKIKLEYKGKRVKGFSVTGNLNNSNKKMIMVNITPHIQMRVKVIYSFKSLIYRGRGEIKPYSKTLDSSSGMFTSLKEIQAYVEEYEQKGQIWITKKYGQKVIYPPQEQPRYEAIMNAKSFLSMLQ